jgi:NADH-quinone oxidoreductase subunit N
MKAIIATTIAGIIMMFAALVMKEKKHAATLATILLFALLGVNIWDLVTTKPDAPQLFFSNMLRVEHYSLWFNTLMTGCSVLYVLLVGKEIQKVGAYTAEYFALIFFILCGVFLLSSYNNMLMLFLGIEIMSIPQYILAGSEKRNLKSSEASLKYFLMGAFSTGILLMGITLLYGASRTFNIKEMESMLHSDALDPMALAGIIFVMIALSFKVSAAPMHMWTPDVYDGAPTPFTAYMATIVKVGAFFAFLRLFQVSFGNLGRAWTVLLSVITAATLLVGNVTAVFQQSVKRMLAYSSIAQAGFMLFAVLAINAISWQGIIIYAVAYSVATIGLFAVLMKLKDYTYDGFNGLAKSEPLLAFTATIFLLSLAGIPLTGGFMAKYYMLLAVVQQGDFMWIVIFALLMAAISIYYYFRVIMAMYFKQGTPEIASPVTAGDKFMLVLTCILVILIGVLPQLFLNGV